MEPRLARRAAMRVTIIAHEDRLEWTCDTTKKSDVLMVHDVIDIALRHGSERSFKASARIAVVALRTLGVQVELRQGGPVTAARPMGPRHTAGPSGRASGVRRAGSVTG